MQVKNVQYHRNMPFDEYLKLPGYSYSGIKNAGLPLITLTNKMRIGTAVHNYLFEPEKYDYKDFRLIKELAYQVKLTLGDALIGLESEVGVTAEFYHEDFVMPYKGRVDLLRVDRVVIDLKVSEKPLSKTIPFFGYDRQLSGYSLATSARVQMILRICPVTAKTELKLIPISSEWWEKRVLKYGMPY